MNTAEYTIDPEKDLFHFMDKVFYTQSGALKVMKIKRSTFFKDIKNGLLTVFKHPAAGDLVSEEAIAAWEIHRTKYAKNKKR